MYCLFPVPYLSTNLCGREVIIQLTSLFDLLTALLEFLALEGARLGSLFSKREGLQPFILINYTYSMHN